MPYFFSKRKISTSDPSDSFSISREIQRLALGGSAFLLASIFGNGLTFLMGIYIARKLGSEEFGTYALGLTFFNILVLLSPLGLETSVVKFVSERRALNNWEGSRRSVFQTLAIGLVSSLLFATLLALFAKPVAIFYQAPELLQVLLIFSLAVPLATVSNLSVFSLQAFQSFKFMIFIKYLWEPVGKFFIVALFVMLGFKLYGILFSYLIVSAISAISGLIAVGRISGGVSANYSFGSKQELLALASFCFPLLVTNLLGIIAPRMDVLILGNWVNLKEVAYYSAASQTTAVLALVLGGFNQIFSPKFGQILAMGDKERMKTVIHAVSKWSFMFAIPVFLVLIVFGHEILSVFGKDFSQSYFCLVLLAIGQIIYSLLGATTTVLAMSGHSKKIMVNTMIVSPFLIILHLTLIPLIGIIGAAIAVSLSNVLSGILGLVQVWRIHHIFPFDQEILKPALAGLVAWVGASVLKGLLSSGFLSPIIILFILSVYLFTLFQMKQLDPLFSKGT